LFSLITFFSFFLTITKSFKNSTIFVYSLTNFSLS
jgi:hypothetical protein